MKLQVTVLLGMLLTVYGYPAPVKRSPQTIFGPLVPTPITQRTSGVSVAVDTAPQYPDLSYEPMIPYPMMEPSSGVSVTVDTARDYDDGYLRPYAMYKRQTTPMESSTSTPSGGSVNPVGSVTSSTPATSRYIWFDPMPTMLRSQPASSQEPLNPLGSSTSGSPSTRYIWIDPMPPMLRGLPASTQEPLNPLTSASRGLPVGQYANAMAYAKSRPPANQVPAMQVLPMQQLNTGTLIGN